MTFRLMYDAISLFQTYRILDQTHRWICYTSPHLMLGDPVGGGVPPREAVAGRDGGPQGLSPHLHVRPS